MLMVIFEATRHRQNKHWSCTFSASRKNADGRYGRTREPKHMT